MRRLTMLTAVLVAGGLVAGFPAPALATTTPDFGCTNPGTGTNYRLSASAHYTDSPERGLRYWDAFRFKVEGGDADDDHNNVNIRVTEYGSLLYYDYHSPDSIEFNHWYTVRPDPPVRTSIYSSNLNALIEVEAIFDLPGRDDIRCTGALNTK
jgi:hypothetical protein